MAPKQNFYLLVTFSCPDDLQTVLEFALNYEAKSYSRGNLNSVVLEFYSRYDLRDFCGELLMYNLGFGLKAVKHEAVFS